MFEMLSLVIDHFNLLSLFISNTHTNDLLIYIMPARYNGAQTIFLFLCRNV